MTYRHICGLRAMFPREEPPRQVVGCGYVWEHERVNGDRSGVYRSKHLCPNCNCGPWYAIANEGEGIVSPPIPRVAFGRVLRPADDNLAYVKPEELEEFYRYASSGENQMEREIVSFLEGLIGEKSLPAQGMQVIVFDEENKTISGFDFELKRRRR